MAFIIHSVWKTQSPSMQNKDANVRDMLKMRVIEMKERRKKHAINKVVQENPHLGYDGVPKKHAPTLSFNESYEMPPKPQ